MKDCEICPFLEGQTVNDKDVLLQGERWVAVLDKNQEYLGKSFVTLREHKNTISDLSTGDWNELHEIITKLEAAMKTAFSANVMNWSCLMNNAVLAGQPTHVHWHLHPRYLTGATFEGEDFPDSTWPLRREKTPNIVSDELFDKIANKVRENL